MRVTEGRPAEKTSARGPVRRLLSFFKQEIRTLTGKYPFLFSVYMILVERRHRWLRTQPDTQIVIEGFGGSANSFATRAFRLSQPHRIKCAHHLHVPAQIILAIRWNVPVIVLLREPEEACTSLLSRDYYPSARQALRHYIRFYQAVLRYRDHVVIAPFEDVTQGYGKIIEKVNRKFETEFVPFVHNQANADRIIDGFDKADNLKPGPREERKALKEAARQRVNATSATLRQKANATYLAFKNETSGNAR